MNTFALMMLSISVCCSLWSLICSVTKIKELEEKYEKIKEFNERVLEHGREVIDSNIRIVRHDREVIDFNTELIERLTKYEKEIQEKGNIVR